MTSLYCVQGKERGRRYSLAEIEEVTIGRSPGEGGIVISDILASRQHLRLTIDGGTISATDLQSANGTQLNGRPINGTVQAGPGDIFTLGDTSLIIEGEKSNSTDSNAVSPIQDRLKRNSQLLRTAEIRPMTPQPPGAMLTTDEAILPFLLSSLPIAVLIHDVSGQVLIANEHLKHLAGVAVIAGRPVNMVLEQLSAHLRHPADIEALKNGSHGDTMRLETADAWSWSAWVYEDQDLRAIYLLPEQDLA